jgi:hypothetical protein
LVEVGEMDIATAIAELVSPFEQLVGPLLCDCSRDFVARAERDYPPVRDKSSRARGPTSQATVEALMYCVRERGIQALKEPANIERLRRCDKAAKAQVNERIAKSVEGRASNG